MWADGAFWALDSLGADEVSVRRPCSVWVLPSKAGAVPFVGRGGACVALWALGAGFAGGSGGADRALGAGFALNALGACFTGGSGGADRALGADFTLNALGALDSLYALQALGAVYTVYTVSSSASNTCPSA